MSSLLLILFSSLQVTADKDAEAAITRFRKDYKAVEVGKRVLAVTELAKVEHLKVLGALSPIVVHEDTDVRSAAVEGIGGWKTHQPEVIKILAAQFKIEVRDQKSEMPFEPFLDAFGKLRAKSVLPDIHLLFQYWDPEYVDPAVRTVGVIRCRDSIDPLIKLWQRDEQQAADKNVLNDKIRPKLNAEIEARAVLIRQALKSIAAQEFRTSSEARNWWKDNKSTFKDP